MIGSIIRYIGLHPDTELYPQFIGAVGYVEKYHRRAKDNTEHVSVVWFKPVVHSKVRVRKSHFALERFEILSGPSPGAGPPNT